MFSFLYSYFKTVVGLEITDNDIKLLCVTHARDQYVIDNYALGLLPKEAIIDGKIKRFDQVHAVLQRLVKQTKSFGFATALAMPSQNVICKSIQLPASYNDKECLTDIRENLPRYLPGIKETLIFDYTKLFSAETQYKNYLLVATRAEHLQTYEALVKHSGLKLQVIDVDTHALCRSLYKGITGSLKTDNPLFYIEVTATLTKLLAVQHHQIIFQQHWPTQQEHWGLHAQRAIQLFLTTQNEIMPKHIFISENNLFYKAQLESIVNTKIDVANPFMGIKLKPHLNSGDFEVHSARLKVCYGLAVRRISK